MAATTTRKKRVQFFEVLDKNGNPFTDSIDWAKALALLAQQPPEKRMHSVRGVDHWGQVYPYLDTDHLVLARNRDEGVSSFDTSTGEIIDNEHDVGKPWVELSVVSFLSRTNFLGFVLGSAAAPRVSSLESWLNQHFGEEITIAPVLSSDVMSKIQSAPEAKLLRLRLNGHQLGSVGRQNGLFGAFESVKDAQGSVDVELVVRVKGRANLSRREERERLIRTARTVSGDQFDKAVVEIINYDADGKPEYEKIDFVSHMVSKTMLVSATDAEGRPIRIQSAITAILQAADALSDDLMTA